MVINRVRQPFLVRVFETFLARPAIYQTELFCGKYEHQARENLKRSIQRLHK
jgi:predicted metal-dependent HD superfamily phosphohydrolase